MNDGGRAFGLRQQDRVGPRGDDRVEIVVDQAGCNAVDAHDQARAACCRDMRAQKSRRALARLRLERGRDRIFQIDQQRIGAARQALVELLVAVGGDEQERAHMES